MTRVTKRHLTKPKTTATDGATLPTFMDHVRELQGRLFAVACVFLLASGVAYPYFDKIVNLIVQPLGNKHELVYLTPGGAFSFVIKVCMYIGLVAAMPMLIYQIYRFTMPAVKSVNFKAVFGYTIASMLLAVGGIAFAYVVSLPAAIQFLTGFNLFHIDPMLTIDSYLSFVITYLLAGAILFQIPLVMLIIDAATPLKPGKMMKFQDKMIIGSFAVAAIISPTPDALNQALLASPMVVMYQVGIILIMMRHGRKNRKAKKALKAITKAEKKAAKAANTRPVPATPVLAAAPASLWDSNESDTKGAPYLDFEHALHDVTQGASIKPSRPVVRHGKSMDMVYAPKKMVKSYQPVSTKAQQVNVQKDLRHTFVSRTTAHGKCFDVHPARIAPQLSVSARQGSTLRKDFGVTMIHRSRPNNTRSLDGFMVPSQG